MPQPSRFITARLSIRRGTKDQWETENTVLLEGEPGWELDTRRLKIGDGETAWSDLNYYTVGDSEASGSVIHDSTVLPEHINSVSSAVEYFGAKFKVYDDQGANEFIAGLQGSAPQYVLTLAAGTGGTASSGSSSSVVSAATLITITASPFTGYEFDYWQGDNITDTTSSQTTVLIKQDQYVRANFKLIQ